MGLMVFHGTGCFEYDAVNLSEERSNFLIIELFSPLIPVVGEYMLSQIDRQPTV